ncbi:MAG: glucose-6-phosphate dehydrogenase [Planctomycetota bacterium]
MPSVSPCAIVIYGASGDLAKLKLIPALYELLREGLLPASFALVGYSRTKMSHDDFRERCREAVKANARSAKGGSVDEALLETLCKNAYYHPGGYDDVGRFDELKTFLDELDGQHGTQGNRLFYLSTPPSTFAPIVETLGERGLITRGDNETSWQRVIIEKPFGTDLATAEKLNEQLHGVLDEGQIFRIDHYLGKETVQNLMVARFANSIFEPLWTHQHVDHVQITVAESVNADDRAGYYDKSGALRDMVQNHIFQLLALTAMEPPANLDAKSIRDEKVKVFRSIRPVDPKDVDDHAVRGQYGSGEAGGKSTDGYTNAEGVEAGSQTETFAAVKVQVDNWRWNGTPFYIRTGKALKEKLSEIVVRFRRPPQTLFGKTCESPVFANDLVIRVAPEEGMTLLINGKVPGGQMQIKEVALDFNYSETFNKQPPEAYERLIHDAIVGDQTLFIRGDEAEAAWRVIDPILEGWAKHAKPPQEYEPGGWGPKASNDLLAADGRTWMHEDHAEDAVIACATHVPDELM